jgi:hypothetical protein
MDLYFRSNWLDCFLAAFSPSPREDSCPVCVRFRQLSQEETAQKSLSRTHPIPRIKERTLEHMDGIEAAVIVGRDYRTHTTSKRRVLLPPTPSSVRRYLCLSVMADKQAILRRSHRPGSQRCGTSTQSRPHQRTHLGVVDENFLLEGPEPTL